jgi:hypothetical protein
LVFKFRGGSEKKDNEKTGDCCKHQWSGAYSNIKRLIRGVSALLTSPEPVKRTLAHFVFLRSRWRLPVLKRTIFPEPVTRKRFLHPECDFIFGIIREFVFW